MARAGRGGTVLADVLAIWDGVRSVLPYLEDEAIVIVHGSPTALRRELYFLAAAIGFSLVRRYDIAAGLGPPPSIIMLEWDAATNVVKFTLKYKTCLASASIDPDNALKNLYLMTGPPEEVVGAGWNYTGVLAAGIDSLGPISGALALVPGAKDMLGITPKIPAPSVRMAGRPILTRNASCSDPNPFNPIGGKVVASPNPRPSGDGRSRGTFYQMVYTALTTPQGAGLKEFPAASPDTFYTGG